MKIIKLNKGYETIVDDKYFDILNKRKWFINYSNGVPRYAAFTFRKNKNNYCTLMHRMIMELEGYKIKGKQIDHINGNGLDNRLENLRLASHSENQRNSKLRKDNTSGYKGVVWNKRDKVWFALLRIGKKRLNLGSFDNKIDAAKAYNEAAIKYYGEFANLNEI